MVVVKGKTSATLHGLDVTDAPPGTVFSYQEKQVDVGKAGRNVVS